MCEGKKEESERARERARERERGRIEGEKKNKLAEYTGSLSRQCRYVFR